MEIGLYVYYDGKKNNVFQKGLTEYKIGALACEYARLRPADLREIIYSYTHRNEKFSKDIFADAIDCIRIETERKFGLVISIMFATELFQAIYELVDKSKEELDKYFFAINKEAKNDQIKTYILENSQTKKFSIDTVGNAIDYAYYVFATNYAIFKICFNRIFNDDSCIEQEQKDNYVAMLLSFYGENFNIQKIDYKIMNLEGKFASIYTIQNSASLLLFELAHIIETDTIVKKCEICKNYFVPKNRSDTLYCDYPYHKYQSKTCKQIGPLLKRAKKEKTDIFTKEYRKAYMRLKMKTVRNPNRSDYSEQLKQMVDEAKEIRKKVESQEIDEQEWKTWLDKYSGN